MDFPTILQILDATVRTSTPLLLAALAGLYSERSGVFDIGLEGKMLGAAFAAGAGAAVFQSAWAGLFLGILIAVSLSMVHGFASITARGNQIVSGVAINFFAAGTTILLGASWFMQGGRTPQLPNEWRFTQITLPGADALAGIPLLGPIWSDLISGHNLLVYFAFAMVPFTWWVLYRTRFGLRLRAVGENPAAVDTAGISVTLLRYKALVICGVLCGVAGAYLAIAQSAGFVKGMTAGRGFIALAALIFAKWRPVPVLFACLLFGFLDTVGNRFIGKAIPPRAGGVPYVKER
ncbi:MAG: ABC transporter permease [Nitratireductor sp.]|nr:ABC transporter permease [Nitratireductor sp.]